jgi:hypothetical protein
LLTNTQISATNNLADTVDGTTIGNFGYTGSSGGYTLASFNADGAYDCK